MESNVIIIAACLPTLRPVFKFVRGDIQKKPSGQPNTSSSSNHYRLSSSIKNSKGRVKDPFGTDTIDLVQHEDLENALPPNRIRRTFDVSVDHDSQDDGQPVRNYSLSG